MELEAYEDGTLLYIGPKAGDAVPIDAVIAVIGEKGADYQALIKHHEASKGGKKEASSKEEKEVKAEVTKAETSETGGRIKASPLAKKLAEEKGYDLSKI